MNDFFYDYINFILILIENNFLLSLISYVIFLIIFLSLSLPGNIIFFLLSGFLFGLYLGFFINIFCIVSGSFIFFLFAKYLFLKFFNNFYLKYSKKINNIIKNSSIEYLIILRLIPGPPLMAQNICLSILSISKIKFILTTFIGFIPLMFLTAFVGSEFSNFIELKNFDTSDIFSYKFLLIIVVIVFIIFLKIIFKKRKNY